MRLSRTQCNGTCPVYVVVVSGNGAVTYQGMASVWVLGEHRSTITREAMKKLVGLFRDSDYYSLNDQYIDNAFDIPTYEMSIEIDGKRKTIVDHGGLRVGMPVSVFDLENTVDEFADTRRWILAPGAETH